MEFRFGKCINEELELISPEAGRNEVLERTAKLVDRKYTGITLPINYIAYDRMTGAIGLQAITKRRGGSI